MFSIYILLYAEFASVLGAPVCFVVEEACCLVNTDRRSIMGGVGFITYRTSVCRWQPGRTIQGHGGRLLTYPAQISPS